jgi:hypothetical protein
VTQIVKEASKLDFYTYLARSTGKERGMQHFQCAWKWVCPSYIKFHIKNNTLKLYCWNWTHSHPFDTELLTSTNIIPLAVQHEVAKMTEMHCTAGNIRLNLDLGISKDALYCLRRTQLRAQKSNEVAFLIQEISHWGNWDTKVNIDLGVFLAMYFVNKRTLNSLAIMENIFMDDTARTNFHDFPVFILLGVDENDINQVVSFGILKDRTFISISKYLEYIKAKISIIPRVFITDRCAIQFSAIQTVFPNTSIIFCRKHLSANISTVLKSPEFLDLFWSTMKHRNPELSLISQLNQIMADATNYSEKQRVFALELFKCQQHWLPSLTEQISRHSSTSRIEGFNAKSKILMDHSPQRLTTIALAIKTLSKISLRNTVSCTEEVLPPELITSEDAHPIGLFAQRILL